METKYFCRLPGSKVIVDATSEWGIDIKMLKSPASSDIKIDLKQPTDFKMLPSNRFGNRLWVCDIRTKVITEYDVEHWHKTWCLTL